MRLALALAGLPLTAVQQAGLEPGKILNVRQRRQKITAPIPHQVFHSALFLAPPRVTYSLSKRKGDRKETQAACSWRFFPMSPTYLVTKRAATAVPFSMAKTPLTDPLFYDHAHLSTKRLPMRYRR